MGTNVSKQEVELFKKNLIDASTRYISEDNKFSEIVQQSEQVQKNVFDSSKIKDCPGLTIGQTMNVEFRVYNEMTAEKELDLQNYLENKMDDIIEQTSKQTNEKFNFLQTNVAQTSGKTYQEAVTDLSTTISSKIRQEYNNEFYQKQTLDNLFNNFEFICPEGSEKGVDIRQDMNVKLAVENAMNSKEVNNLLNDAVTQTSASITQEDSQLNVGMGLIISFVILVIIVIGVIIFFVWKSRKGATKIILDNNSNTLKFLFGKPKKRFKKRN